MVLGQGLAVAGAGVLLGLGAAAATGALVRGLLFGVGAVDGLGFAGAGLLVLAAAAAGCWLPARRVAGVDPATVLRSD